MSKRDIHFLDSGWTDYLYWQRVDKKMLNKINRLITETQREPFVGIGKPEPLRENFAGFWSRRIDDEHRFIYAVDDEAIHIIGCRYHYSK